LQIDLEDQTQSLAVDQLELLEGLLQFLAKKMDIPSQAEISIIIVDNPKIQQLNHAYRQINEATDVLSFPLQEDNQSFDIDFPVALGDIVISVEKAKEQAVTYGHSFERELGFLLVHGFLHLLGYDHDTEEAEQSMFAKQKELLSEFGLER